MNILVIDSFKGYKGFLVEAYVKAQQYVVRIDSVEENSGRMHRVLLFPELGNQAVQGRFIFGGQNRDGRIGPAGPSEIFQEHGANQFEFPCHEPCVLFIVVGDDNEIRTADLYPGRTIRGPGAGTGESGQDDG